MKNSSLLLKGFEVELFTGRSTGQHVGVAVAVTKDLPEFVKEPDHRNLEYITSPEANYAKLKEDLLAPRRRLRSWLAKKHLTLLPCSTLSLGDSSIFERSDPGNPYHDLIESLYGTKVVTASVHINLGITDLNKLFAALRLVRCEAAIFLALSASSPFLDGELTGAHSQRWLQFPRTPKKVPFFRDHDHYVEWVQMHLANGTMQNERHLWTSVRPNGPSRPYDLNRMELRICDLITDPSMLLALTALLELRVINLLRNPEKFDPFHVSDLTSEELVEISDSNDIKAAKDSLNASLVHWKDGRTITAIDWVQELLNETIPLAEELNLTEQLEPLRDALEEGNQAMKWLKSFGLGFTVQSVIEKAISSMAAEEMLDSNREVLLG